MSRVQGGDIGVESVLLEIKGFMDQPYNIKTSEGWKGLRTNKKRLATALGLVAGQPTSQRSAHLMNLYDIQVWNEALPAIYMPAEAKTYNWL